MSTDPISKYNSNGIDFCTYMNDTYPYVHTSNANLQGRNVLITGTSKGIGYELALSFARAGASGIAVGARSPLDGLAAAMRRAAEEAGRPAPKIVQLELDVSERASTEAAARVLRRELGTLDVVLLNAAVIEPQANLLDQDVDAWWRVWQTNTLGAFLTLRAALPLLLARPDGLKTVVGMTSIGATLGTEAGYTAYQPGKLALSRLMEHVNAEYGRDGVLAYSCHPGGVLTDMASTLPQQVHHMLVDTPQLPADTIVWLTKERREWLAGRYVACNWNMEEFEAKRPDIERRDLLKFRLPMGGEDWNLERNSQL